jgi:hypothetical protein
MAHGDAGGDRAAVGTVATSSIVTLSPDQLLELLDAAAAPGKAKSGVGELGRIGQLGFVTAAVLSALLTLLTVVFLLVPRLEPAKPLPAPSSLGATLNDVRLEERAVRPDGTLSLLVSYDVEFAAYKGHEGLIEWSAFDAQSLQRYDLEANRIDPTLPNVDGAKVVADAPTDRASGTINVPVPLKSQCIFVRVYVSEPKKDGTMTRQDYADSAPFDTHDPSNRSCAGLSGDATPTS